MNRIEHVIVTPVAFVDPPLLNAAGVHEPWCLRSVIELKVEGGVTGLGETYGDELILSYLNAAAAGLVGIDIFDHAAMRRAIAVAIKSVHRPGGPASPRTSEETLQARVFAAFEVAALDAMGHAAGRPVYDLLGGRVRDLVPFSAYLFFKFKEHRFTPDPIPDPWGEVTTPEAVVREAQRMVELHGFQSLKLKGGAFEPDAEVDAILALRDAFPDAPLRIDPNCNWSVATTRKLLPRLEGVLEYLEDPVAGFAGMAEIKKATSLPLATNTCVVAFQHLPPAIAQASVDIVLGDHHFWGGLVATRELGRICDTWNLGLSMHSNSHLGISLMAMAHVAAATPNLTYACDTHYPWAEDDVVAGGRIAFEQGNIRVHDRPGLGIEIDPAALARLHGNYQRSPYKTRNDGIEIKKYWPDWTPERPRF